ncbi:MAG: methyltransferase [Nitrospirota bacterium]
MISQPDTISIYGSGVVSVFQPKKGHRMTLDSLLLADFCRIKKQENVLELGTGTGIISLLLAKKFPHIQITAVEVQPGLANLCRKNITQNNLDSRIILLEQNLTRRMLPSSSFDVIVANPPYVRKGTGKQGTKDERIFSRHDHLGSLSSWLGLQTVLKNKGRYVLIFPASRSAELVSTLISKKLEPKRMRFIHSHEQKPASCVMIEAVKAAGIGLQVLPPLIVHKKDGTYTEEMKKIYAMDKTARVVL